MNVDAVAASTFSHYQSDFALSRRNITWGYVGTKALSRAESGFRPTYRIGGVLQVGLVVDEQLTEMIA
jgi:hypothetical protein